MPINTQILTMAAGFLYFNRYVNQVCSYGKKKNNL